MDLYTIKQMLSSIHKYINMTCDNLINQPKKKKLSSQTIEIYNKISNPKPKPKLSYKVYDIYTNIENNNINEIVLLKPIIEPKYEIINNDELNKLYAIAYLKDTKLYLMYEDKIQINNNIKCRQYEPKISNKFCKNINKLKYEIVSIKDYKPNESYGNCVKSIKNNGFYSIYFENKILFENNINFNCDSLKYTLIYYDIETYNETNYDDVPDVNNNQSHIGIVGLYIINSNKIQEYHIFCSNVYKFDKSQILNKINCKDIVIHIYENENILSQNVITFINNIKGLKFLIGFNSSISFSNDNNNFGYDLTFILNKSHYNYKCDIKYGVKIYNSYNAKQVMTCDLLHDTYFMDMSYLLYQDLLPNEHKEIENYKLDSYLTYFNLQGKLDHNYEDLQYRLHTNITDISDIMAYCLYDCIALHKLIEKRNIIIKMFEWCKLLNLPLNYVLYQSQANLMKLYITRQYYENNLICHYDKIYVETDENKSKYQGAITLLPDSKYLYTPIDIMGIDFSSLYPSTIRQHNISPETVYINPLKNKEYNILQVNDTKNLSIDKLYVSKIPGIIPKIIQKLYDLRIQTKEYLSSNKLNNDQYNQLDIKQYTLKIAMNTIYGLMGNQTNNILFNHYAALLITNEARINILYLQNLLIENKHEVIFIDTDSCFIVNKFKSIDEHKTFIKDLNTTLKLRSPCLSVTLELYYKTMFINKKKSHLEFIINEHEYENYYNNIINLDKYKLSIKGISWSTMSPFIKNEIKYIINKILTSCENIEDIRKLINIYINKHHLIILDAIKNNNCNKLENYAKKIRLIGSKTQLSENIKSNFNIHDSYCYVVELNNKKCKKKSDKTIPINCLNNDNIKSINIQTLLDNITHPLKKLFDYNINKLYDKYDFIEDDNLIIYRIDKINKQKKTVILTKHQSSINNLEYDILKNGSKQSYNEIIMTNINKMFFDIESHEEIDIKHFISFLQIDILNNYNDIPIHICCANTLNKYSYHVVCDIKVELNYNLQIAVKYNTKHHNICDLSVYCINKSLRLPLCCKIKTKYHKMTYENFNDVYENRQFKILSKSQFKNFAITMVSDINILLITPLIYDDNVIHDISNTNINAKHKDNNIDDKFKQSVIDYCKENNIHVLLTVYMNFIYIKSLKTFFCKICNRLHDNDNLYAYKKYDIVYINCFRNKANNNINKPVVLVGHVESEKNDMTEIQSKIDYVNKACQDYDKNTKLSLNYINIDKLDIDFNDIFQQYIFVKSDLGTFKTTCLKKYIDNFCYNKTILVISFRISFANDFANKFNFISYQQIKGVISNDNYKSVVLQIDSLLRYIDKVNIDLLVCDEIESIFNQLFEMKQNKYNDVVLIYQRFINLIKNSKKCIFMDGLLEQSTIRFIKYMCNIDDDHIRFINNVYKPKINNTYELNIIHHKSINEHEIIMNNIIDLLKNNKKIAVFSQSSNFAHTLEKYIIMLNLNINILLYTGRDFHFNGVDFMKNAKYNDILLTGINNVLNDKQCQLFIYTSTITAGISIDYEFDILFHISCPNTNDIISTYQALHRVRNIKEKLIKSYIINKHIFKPITCMQVFNCMHEYNTDYNNKIFEFELFLNTRKHSLQVLEIDLLLKYLFSSGYTVKLNNFNNELDHDPIYEDAVLSSNPKLKFANIIKVCIVNNDLTILDNLPDITEIDINILEKIKHLEFIQYDNLNDKNLLELKFIIFKKCKLLNINPLIYKHYENIIKIHNNMSSSKEKKILNKKKGEYIINKFKDINNYNTFVNEKDIDNYYACNKDYEVQNQIKVYEEKTIIKQINIANDINDAIKDKTIDRDEYNSIISNIFQKYKIKFSTKSICLVNEYLSFINKQLIIKLKRSNITDYRYYYIDDL